MQTIRIRTTQNVFIEYPLASVSDRILAFLIDILILVLYTVCVAAVFAKIEVEAAYVTYITLAFPWLFFSVVFEIFMNGQTPGKRVLKIKVVRLDGTPPTVGNYIMRWIFSFVDYYLLAGALAVIVIAMGGKGQRLGDIVAGTSVVKLVESREIAVQQVFVSPEEQYTPTFTQVSTLSEKDIELIQRALEVNRDQGNMQPVLVVTNKIKTLLNIETDMPPVTFLYTIIKDYKAITAA